MLGIDEGRRALQTDMTAGIPYLKQMWQRQATPINGRGDLLT